VEKYTRMWLTLGADCIKAASSSHQQEVAEALGLASHRWNKLLAMEEQVVREEQDLAGAAEGAPIAAW
jgi:hypothetical protein